MSDLISIIVPVYNVENFLDECIYSLRKQTYDNLEMILIDDGSTDNSLTLCRKHEAQDERIRVFTKCNEGLGLTRNFGINRAHGRYICFVDSDDYLLHDAIESMYEMAVDVDADLVSANTIYKGQPMEVSLQEGVYNSEKINSIVLQRIMGNYPGKIDAYTYTSTAKLFRLSLLLEKNIKFPSERELIWEDLVFSTSLYPLCESFVIMHKPVYYYRFNQYSLTHRYTPEKFDKIICLYKYMIKQITKLELGDEAQLRLANNFLGHIRTCIKLEVFYAHENGFSHVISEIKRICKNQTVNEIMDLIPASEYNKLQMIYSYCIKWHMIKSIYMLTWLQNKKKRIE
jgi:glycosyltransferase involved in cell wall biosynthesis|nr:glycosyltransferase family 2 protein [uncultured Acetatifactor sp.]